MKIYILLFIFSFSAFAREIKIEDVSKYVGSKNYVVLENAQLTYQSQEAVGFARNNLLPQLNVWDVAGIAFSWSNALGVVQDIAPFLVPANWFRVKEQKILFEAQKFGYNAVWANQIAVSKALFYRLDHDIKLLSSIKKNIKDLGNIHTILKTREIFGGAQIGDSKILEQRILELQDDQKRIEYLIAEEKSKLKYILAIGAEEDISLKAIDLELETKPFLEFNKLYPVALTKSPEIKQFKEFIKVIPQIKKEVRFSFLGTSSISRGVGGGIFDDIPVQRGLGFGAGNTMAILRSKEEIMKLQLIGVEETIKNQLKVLVEIYNSDIDYYRNLKDRVQLSKMIQQSYLERLQMGQTISVWDIVDASRGLMNSELQYNSLISRFLDTNEKIERNLMQGDYSFLPNFEELLKAASQK